MNLETSLLSHNLDQTRIPFDNKTLNYDVGEHDLPAIVLETIQKIRPEVTALDTLHEVIPPGEVSHVMALASKELLNTDFYNHFDQIVHDEIVPQIGTDVLIQKFGNLRALIPDQDKIGAMLLWHQGRWVGNGLGLRTIWMPFTSCFESNSMQIMDLDISRKITRDVVRDDWSYDQLKQACLEHSWPITLDPGQAHLFFQEHIHGNIPNHTNKTRVSIDIRLLVKDGQPHRKWPGAYFRPLFDRAWTKSVPVKDDEVVVTYGEFEGFKTRQLDLFFQTEVVKSYCRRKDIPFPYQHGENEGTNYAFMEHLIENNKMDHFLLFSIFSLPDNKEKRLSMMRRFLDRGIRVHFCNEELVLENQQDLEKIEYLRSFTEDWSSPVAQLEEEIKNSS